MAIQNLDQIRTKKSERENIRVVVEKLREIMKLPQITDLADSVFISRYTSGGSCYNYGNLYITAKGLEEITGYHDGCCFDGSPSDSYQNDPKIIRPNDFERIVKQYQLSREDMDKLSAKLKE
jgi:hypothetical protein